MAHGKLEVLLVGAKGIEDSDFFSKVDPYATLICRTQEQKSSVSSGGSTPEWNETFVFTISGSVSDLTVKLFDKDTFSADDFLGEAVIPLEPVFQEGNLAAAAYNIVKDGEYRGQVRVALTFTPERSRGYELPDEDVGGWKQSSYN